MPGENQRAVVEQIELVYYTLDPQDIEAGEDDTASYVQPVWRFSGHYEDGTFFQILVQALVETYLQP